jgi:hypothetical protein
LEELNIVLPKSLTNKKQLKDILVANLQRRSSAIVDTDTDRNRHLHMPETRDDVGRDAAPSRYFLQQAPVVAAIARPISAAVGSEAAARMNTIQGPLLAANQSAGLETNMAAPIDHVDMSNFQSLQAAVGGLQQTVASLCNLNTTMFSDLYTRAILC